MPQRVLTLKYPSRQSRSTSLWHISTLLASSLQSSNRKPLEITMPNLANGFLCFGPATFVSVAFILSQFAQQGCSFVGLPSEGQDTNIFDKSTASYAGIYCWQGVGGQKWLYAYAWEGLGYARQMALASTVMGAVVWCFFLFSSCMRYHPAIWFLLSLILLATTVTQALQFQMFSNDVCSDGGCTLGTSSRVGISACVFWFISAIMTCGIAKEAKDKQSSESEDN
mmetsp:Transcript_2371/g.5186  ORF Transcript_2371/g.5186 Transcript_2371/m.5186 type:complete len:225 (-) Transcript_2371:1864-2538(-)